MPTNHVSIASSTSYVASGYFKVTSGTVTGLQFGPIWRTSAGVFISAGISSVSLDSTRQRITKVAVSPETAEKAEVELFGVSGSYNFTIRIYALNFVQGTSASSVILSNGTPTVREPDNLNITPTHDTYDISIEFDDASTQTLNGVVIGEGGWSVPTNLNKGYITKITGVQA
jgi:hypothetical protein